MGRSLVIANQSGWFVENRLPFRAIWDGGPGPGHLKILFHESWGDGGPPVVSWFGNGILTFHLPFVIRTEPGYNLWVMGPPNSFKDGIHALSAMIETDWMPYTFTMNWKFTRPQVPVRFEQGEPFCFLFPVKRGALQRMIDKARPTSAARASTRPRTWRAVAYVPSRGRLAPLVRSSTR